MNIIDLGGHSGCKILLYEMDDNSVFVRKISGSKDYNGRLRIQAEKQENFHSSHIKTPRVLSKGYTDDGLFYFDMEYVQGITLSEYMNRIEIGKIRGLVNKIVDSIISDDIHYGNVRTEVFLTKISSLEKKLPIDDYAVDKALALLKNHSWSKYVITSCHGDLTLENIIVKDDKLYYIDFLDSFYDCWIMDFSTLLQDAQVMWAYRNSEMVNINTVLRLMIFRDILIDEVKKRIGNDYVELYYALLLKLLRIFPYVKDNKTYNFLLEKTLEIVKVIEGEGK